MSTLTLTETDFCRIYNYLRPHINLLMQKMGDARYIVITTSATNIKSCKILGKTFSELDKNDRGDSTFFRQIMCVPITKVGLIIIVNGTHYRHIFEIYMSDLINIDYILKPLKVEDPQDRVLIMNDLREYAETIIFHAFVKNWNTSCEYGKDEIIMVTFDNLSFPTPEYKKRSLSKTLEMIIPYLVSDDDILELIEKLQNRNGQQIIILMYINMARLYFITIYLKELDTKFAFN